MRTRRPSSLPDCYAYVRDYYGVPAYIGVRVRLRDGREGNLMPAPAGRGGQYLHIRLDGERHSGPYHPTDGITYLNVTVAVERGR